MLLLQQYLLFSLDLRLELVMIGVFASWSKLLLFVLARNSRQVPKGFYFRSLGRKISLRK